MRGERGCKRTVAAAKIMRLLFLFSLEVYVVMGELRKGTGKTRVGC